MKIQVYQIDVVRESNHKVSVNEGESLRLNSAKCNRTDRRTVVQVGTQPASVELPASLVMSRELSVLGSFRYTHVFDTVLDLVGAGKVSVDSLASAVCPFGDRRL